MLGPEQVMRKIVESFPRHGSERAHHPLRHTSRTVPLLSHEHWYKNCGGVRRELPEGKKVTAEQIIGTLREGKTWAVFDDDRPCCPCGWRCPERLFWGSKMRINRKVVVNSRQSYFRGIF